MVREMSTRTIIIIAGFVLMIMGLSLALDGKPIEEQYYQEYEGKLISAIRPATVYPNLQIGVTLLCVGGFLELAVAVSLSIVSLAETSEKVNPPKQTSSRTEEEHKES